MNTNEEQKDTEINPPTGELSTDIGNSTDSDGFEDEGEDEDLEEGDEDGSEEETE